MAMGIGELELGVDGLGLKTKRSREGSMGMGFWNQPLLSLNSTFAFFQLCGLRSIYWPLFPHMCMGSMGCGGPVR